MCADPRRPHECRASRGPLDDRPHSQNARRVAGASAPNVMADVSSCALGSGGRGRFLYDVGLDVPRVSDVLHAVRHRPRLTAYPDCGIHTASERSLHGPSRSHGATSSSRSGAWSCGWRRRIRHGALRAKGRCFKATRGGKPLDRVVPQSVPSPRGADGSARRLRLPVMPRLALCPQSPFAPKLLPGHISRSDDGWCNRPASLVRHTPAHDARDVDEVDTSERVTIQIEPDVDPSLPAC